MRLLHIEKDGSFKLTNNFVKEEEIPHYAVLSHRWLSDCEEVDFEDMINGVAQKKPSGYGKIQFCAKQAAEDGLEYIWIDTCCILKSSSQELQEAITTMFKWYRNASRCYVYLMDVSAAANAIDESVIAQPWETAFCKSNWFTRGWTLQELLAPPVVIFFSREGTRLGNKEELQDLIHEITGIPYRALLGAPLSEFSIAERLLWARHRQTTRNEDKAYSLLGILNIFMPLLYGEGEHAFVRLQECLDRKHPEPPGLDHVLDKLPIASSAAFNSFQNQDGSVCLPDTRVELLSRIKIWASGSDDQSVFWLDGAAGTGKSTVARSVARYCHERGRLGGSFFFTKGGGDRGDASRLVTTLAYQLTGTVPAVKRHVCKAISAHQKIYELGLRDQWEQLIIDPLSKLEAGSCPSTTVLILDALDECGNDMHIRMIMRYLTLARNLKTIRLRILVTSRPNTAIRCGFREIPRAERQEFVLHEIHRSLVDRDLKIFYEDRFTNIREERGLSSDWPGSIAITRLVKISGGLFIWAASACLYVRKGKSAAKKRLKKLIDGHDPNDGPQKQLDQIYLTVLEDSISEEYDEEERDEFLEQLRVVLGSIIILRSPLSKASLANLLHVKTDVVTDTLADLHTILLIPKENKDDIRLHHATVRDFLLDKSRCKNLDFWVDSRQVHLLLAKNCLRLMSRMKRNICRIESPSTTVEDISSTQSDEYISPELRYACLNWAEHLRQSGAKPFDHDETHQFLEEHFLHWLEVVSILGESAKVTAIIRMYQSLLQSAVNPEQESWVKDSRRFIFSVQPIIEKTPLQIYSAALAYITSSNPLRARFWHQLDPHLKNLRVVETMNTETKDEYNYVMDLAFTPDCTQLIAGSLHPWVRRWNVATKKPLSKLEGQSDKVSTVAISGDGARIAAGSDDASVIVYDTASGMAERKFSDHTRWVNRVIFSNDSRLLASGSMDETIRLWQVADGKPIAVLQGSSCVNDIAMSPDGRIIASGTTDQVIYLWDIDKEQIRLLLDGHSGPVNSVQFSLDGNLIVSGSDDTTVRLWETDSGHEIRVLRGHTKKVWSATISTDGRIIASGSEDKTLRLWNRETGQQLHTLQGHTSGVNTVAYSPDGKHLASASFDDEVRLWNAVTGETCGRFEESVDDFEAASGTGPLGTAEGMKSLRLLTNAPAMQGPRGHWSAVNCVTFSPNGQIVATGSHDCTLKLWTPDGDELSKLEGHTKSIRQLVFSADGRWIVSCSTDSTARLWSIEERKPIHTFDGHSNAVVFAAFSCDDVLLATCSSDKTIGIWDVTTGAALYTLEGHTDTVNAAAWSLNGRLLASCSSDTTVRIWDISSSVDKQPMILSGHEDNVNSTSFSLDDKHLISSSSDGSIRTWNTTNGLETGKLIGHTEPVNSAVFSSDMTRAVSCSSDKTLLVWDLAARSVLKTFKLDTALRVLVMSDCGRFVHTDRGSLEVGDAIGTITLESTSLEPAEKPNVIYLARDWLRCNNIDIMRLPDNFQVTSFATDRDTAVLGHESGALSFIRL